LEVQGGVDYFRIVEGTTIKCFVLSEGINLNQPRYYRPRT